MNKIELVKEVSKATEKSQKDVALVLDSVVEVVKNTVKNGEDVKLTGFVTFASVDVPETTRRNPATGESMVSPAHKAVKAKVSSAFKKFVR